MHRHVLVPLLEPVVFFDVMEIISPDDDGAIHLHLGDDAGQDATSDRHFAGEGALLVDVVSLTGLKVIKKTISSCSTWLWFSISTRFQNANINLTTVQTLPLWGS